MPQAIPIVLIDDPNEFPPLGLERILAAWRGGLAAVCEPAARLDGEGAAGTLATASRTTFGAPLPLYTMRVRGLPRGVPREVVPEAVVDAVLALVPAPFTLVARVGVRTLPCIEALHADPRTQPLLKVGITDVAFDEAYNLARKLIADGKVHYHERTLSMERFLRHRLERMTHAHANRPAAPVATAAPAAAPGPPQAAAPAVAPPQAPPSGAANP